MLICEKLLQLDRGLLLRDRGSAYSGVRLLRTNHVAIVVYPAHISILMTEQPVQPALTRNLLSSGVCKKSPESGPLLLTTVTRLMPLAVSLSRRDLKLGNSSKRILSQLGDLGMLCFLQIIETAFPNVLFSRLNDNISFASDTRC